MPESIRLQNLKIGLVDAFISPPKTVVQGPTAPQLQEMKRRSDNSDMDEGAQPLPERQTPPGQGILDTYTRRLISRFLSDFTGLSTAAWIQSKAQSTMKRVVTRLVEKHRMVFNGKLKCFLYCSATDLFRTRCSLNFFDPFQPLGCQFVVF